MVKQSFKGGIHPPEKKELCRDRITERVYPSSNTVYIPVTQGGSPNSPVVAPGDIVKKGQIIAKSDSFMSVPVHASISGTVKKITNVLTTGNVDRQVIVIEGNPDEKEKFLSKSEEAFLPVIDPFKCPKEAALERIKQAGIAGMGGASFPTHVKLNPPKDKTIDTVIANAAECEPYLTIDERTLLENANQVVDGIAIEMEILNAQKGIIALEDNKEDLLPYLEKAIAKSSAGKDISVVLCKTKYPQGGEKMLVKAVLKREIPTKGLPADAGCLIQNVGTLKAVSDAFRKGQPLITRSLTVSGEQCSNPKNIEVPVGTLVGDLIPEYITLLPGVYKIISGGPMMGFSMESAGFPVQKNTSGVLFLGKYDCTVSQESYCIGCGRCVKHCPCSLPPVLMMRSLDGGNLEKAQKLGLMDCMECGVCSYVCPASIKLVQRFKTGKDIIREKMRKMNNKEKK